MNFEKSSHQEPQDKDKVAKGCEHLKMMRRLLNKDTESADVQAFMQKVEQEKTDNRIPTPPVTSPEPPPLETTSSPENEIDRITKLIDSIQATIKTSEVHSPDDIPGLQRRIEELEEKLKNLSEE